MICVGCGQPFPVGLQVAADVSRPGDTPRRILELDCPACAAGRLSDIVAMPTLRGLLALRADSRSTGTVDASRLILQLALLIHRV